MSTLVFENVLCIKEETRKVELPRTGVTYERVVNVTYLTVDHEEWPMELMIADTDLCKGTYQTMRNEIWKQGDFGRLIIEGRGILSAEERKRVRDQIIAEKAAEAERLAQQAIVIQEAARKARKGLEKAREDAARKEAERKAKEEELRRVTERSAQAKVIAGQLDEDDSWTKRAKLLELDEPKG